MQLQNHKGCTCLEDMTRQKTNISRMLFFLISALWNGTALQYYLENEMEIKFLLLTSAMLVPGTSLPTLCMFLVGKVFSFFSFYYICFKVSSVDASEVLSEAISLSPQKNFLNILFMLLRQAGTSLTLWYTFFQSSL